MPKNSKDQRQIAGYILHDDTQTETVKELEMWQLYCFLSLALCQIPADKL